MHYPQSQRDTNLHVPLSDPLASSHLSQFLVALATVIKSRNHLPVEELHERLIHRDWFELRNGVASPFDREKSEIVVWIELCPSVVLNHVARSHKVRSCVRRSAPMPWLPLTDHREP